MSSIDELIQRIETLESKSVNSERINASGGIIRDIYSLVILALISIVILSTATQNWNWIVSHASNKNQNDLIDYFKYISYAEELIQVSILLGILSLLKQLYKTLSVSQTPIQEFELKSLKKAEYIYTKVWGITIIIFAALVLYFYLLIK